MSKKIRKDLKYYRYPITKKVFNWSEVQLLEVNSYKIHTLTEYIFFIISCSVKH